MQGLPEHGHEPVMVPEVLGHLGLSGGAHRITVMDCTVGRGGHALHIARAMSGGGTLIAMDVDPENLKYARRRVEEAGIAGVEIRTFHANFGEAPDVLEAAGIERVDALLADFGVSTNQVLEPRHGLSFKARWICGSTREFAPPRRIFWRPGMRKESRRLSRITPRRDTPGESPGKLYRCAPENRYSRRASWRESYGRSSPQSMVNSILPPARFRPCGWRSTQSWRALTNCWPQCLP